MQVLYLHGFASSPESSKATFLSRKFAERGISTIEREFLAEKKRQFNFNAARIAAIHASKIHKVIETRGPDAEDKTWMVSEIVFGPRPLDPQPPNLTHSTPTQ